MKKLILLFFLLFTLLPAGAVKKLDSNPINIAILIVEKGDSTQIKKLFDYYGYSLLGTSDSYLIMKTSSGNEIRYSFIDTNDGSKIQKK